MVHDKKLVLQMKDTLFALALNESLGRAMNEILTGENFIKL
jgi:hypothetical protein